jgi:D-amino-acid oxidase
MWRARSAAPEFRTKWEAMARTSFAMYLSYLRLPGTPIGWTNAYMLSDIAPSEGNGAERRAASPSPAKRPEDSATHDFALYDPQVADITPDVQNLPPGTHPFSTKYASRTPRMTFNIANYSGQLMNAVLMSFHPVAVARAVLPSTMAFQETADTPSVAVESRVV